VPTPTGADTVTRGQVLFDGLDFREGEFAVVRDDLGDIAGMAVGARPLGAGEIASGAELANDGKIVAAARGAAVGAG